MCPDRDLISAYADGEVLSPWKERLEDHLAACPGCAAVAARYGELGERLRGSAAAREEAAAESFALARGRQRLDALLDSMPAPLAPRPRRAIGRYISLPLPIAAAAAVLVLALGGATALLALKPSARGAAIQSVAAGEILPGKALPASMDELLRYLDSGDGQVTLTINLPTSAAYGNAGKPVIMRSSQVIDGTPVGDSAP